MRPLVTVAMIKLLSDSVLDALMPRLCPVCRLPLVAGEESLCLACDMMLPLTNFHQNPDWNPMHERLMCHAPVSRAAAMFYYERMSDYSAIIQEFKYNGLTRLGRSMMRRYARELNQSGFFDGVDALQPVPLNFFKEVARGYNQSEVLAQGVRDVTGIRIADLLKAHRHSSQTRMNASERLENARLAYSIRRGVTAVPTHILLIDDIITTGATVSACAELLHAAYPRAQLSVLSLCLTRLA